MSVGLRNATTGRYEPPTGSLEDEFARRVLKAGSGDCWNWIGAIYPNGFGTLKYGSKRYQSRRLAFSFNRGKIPQGRTVGSSCKNPLCCNPAHLFLNPLAMTREEWNAKRRALSHLVHPPKTVENRFWEKVDKKSPEQCWEWTGGRTQFGYGCIVVNRKLVGAHRVSWELHNGPIRNGLWVLHKCDNPACVNPDHLFLGTHQDNMDDQGRKNRRPVGELTNTAKLTARAVVEIRGLGGKLSQSSIAKRFNVSSGAIQRILAGETWRHV